MGGFSLWHWLIVGIVILLLFGKGRFSSMMGDVASGLKSFKKGMAEEDEVPPTQSAVTREIGTGTTAHGGTVVDVSPSTPSTAVPEDTRRP